MYIFILITYSSILFNESCISILCYEKLFETFYLFVGGQMVNFYHRDEQIALVLTTNLFYKS